MAPGTTGGRFGPPVAPGVSFGRLSAVEPETFSVSWLTPDFQAERGTLVYARLASGLKP